MARAGQGEYIAQAGAQLLESLAIPTQVIAGRAIKQLAVTLKIGLAALAQHLDHHHVLVDRLLQDPAKIVPGPNFLRILSRSSLSSRYLLRGSKPRGRAS